MGEWVTEGYCMTCHVPRGHREGCPVARIEELEAALESIIDNDYGRFSPDATYLQNIAESALKGDKDG